MKKQVYIVMNNPGTNKEEGVVLKEHAFALSV
jgi:hypothetical protein